MLKKSITFLDLDGNPVVEDFYFNLSKAELAELELSKEDGLTEYLTKLTKSTNGPEIIAMFKNIITLTVGRRSEDGRRFIKNKEITDEFLQSDAYSEFFMELISDPEASTAFIKGVMPKDLVEKMDAGATVSDTLNLPEVQVIETVPEQETKDLASKFEDPNWVPSDAEVRELNDPKLLQEAFRRKSLTTGQ